MSIISACEYKQNKHQHTTKYEQHIYVQSPHCLSQSKIGSEIHVHISHADASRQMVATNATRKMSRAVFKAGSVLQKVSKLSTFFSADLLDVRKVQVPVQPANYGPQRLGAGGAASCSTSNLKEKLRQYEQARAAQHLPRMSALHKRPAQCGRQNTCRARTTSTRAD